MNYTKYKLEGSSNPINIGFALILCLILSLFLGWLYNLTFLIPIIYFNVLITVGFGFVLAISLQIITKLLKIRERKTRIYLIIFSTVIAYYSHWIAYIIHITSQKIPNFFEFLNYWIYPQNFFLIVTEINIYGTWSFGFSNILVTGTVLTIIWIVEALIIFFIGINYTIRFPENPFSEKLNKWYPKLTLEYDFASVYSKEKFISNLKENGIDLLLDMDKGFANKFSSISVFYLEAEANQYLTIDTIYIEVRNKAKKNITNVLGPIKISTSEAKSLISKFGTKKEFFLDF